VDADVPLSRGLGSSVTVRLGIIAALNALYGKRLDTDEVLALVTSLEGHPDNAVPALFGGFVVAGMVNNEVRYARARVPSQLKFVAAIPNFEVRTEHARKVLPATVPLRDAVSNITRTALITAAFVHGNYDALHGLFDDKVHQPYRQKLIPQLCDVIEAGMKAGASGGWLSGSGSTIMCLTRRNHVQVANAMKRVFAARHIESRTLVLEADNVGLKMKVI
jgi:homoserine kinase